VAVTEPGIISSSVGADRNLKRTSVAATSGRERELCRFLFRLLRLNGKGKLGRETIMLLICTVVLKRAPALSTFSEIFNEVSSEEECTRSALCLQTQKMQATWRFFQSKGMAAGG